MDRSMSRIRVVPSRIITSPIVTIIILSCNATMEKFEPKDLLLMVNVQLPRSGSLDDFSAIINDLVKQKFPNYQGDFSCDCLESDVNKGTQEGMDLIASRKVTMEEMTPGFLLSLIGRVFVVLKSPLGPPRSRSPGPSNTRSSKDGKRPHKSHSISTDLVDDDVLCCTSFEGDPMPYFLRSPRVSRISTPGHNSLGATISSALNNISRLVR